MSFLSMSSRLDLETSIQYLLKNKYIYEPRHHTTYMNVVVSLYVTEVKTLKFVTNL